MAKRTKAQQAEYDKAIAQLREWIKPGDTVYTVLRHVSRSGTSRHISVVLLQPNAEDPARPIDLHPNYSVSVVTGYPLVRGGASDAIKIGGCGMDMGFQLIYQLSHALYGEGYACLGKGKCSSNYHSNARRQGEAERFDLVHTDGYALRHRWL